MKKVNEITFCGITHEKAVEILKNQDKKYVIVAQRSHISDSTPEKPVTESSKVYDNRFLILY